MADIAVLVVSAEEGVKPQTIEALACIKESETPYVVAINKIDSPKADIERTKQNLAENEIYVEGYGGQIPWVATSAKTGEGVSDLLDTLLLMAELEELKADTSLPASGFVIETSMDRKAGIAATLIVKNGTLKKGMTVLAGSTMAPVRIMQDFQGKPVEEAVFSSPIKIVGFDASPKIGDTFTAYDSKKEAELGLEKNNAFTPSTAAQNGKKKDAGSATPTPLNTVPLENTMTLPIIIKTDVSGTLEAVEHELAKIKHERVFIKVIRSGVGDIGESDVKSAIGSSTIENPVLLVGFSVKVDPLASSLAERSGVKIETFDIIYKLLEWVEATMKEKTPKIQVAENTGKAKVQKLFSKSKDKQIVGGKVLEGVLGLGDQVKIFRREAEIGTGRVRELQQQKLKATEAKKDTEFGTMIESKIELAPGDILESFHMVTK